MFTRTFGILGHIPWIVGLVYKLSVPPKGQVEFEEFSLELAVQFRSFVGGYPHPGLACRPLFKRVVLGGWEKEAAAFRECVVIHDT